jgi:hypothetical protein
MGYESMDQVSLYQWEMSFAGRNMLLVGYLVESRQACRLLIIITSRNCGTRLTIRVDAANHSLLLYGDQDYLPYEQWTP